MASSFQIIGVARTGKYRTLGEDPMPFLYAPLTQRYAGSAVAVVRTAGDPAAFGPEFRGAVRGLDSRLAMFDAGTMRQQLEFAFFAARVSGVLLGATAVDVLTMILRHSLAIAGAGVAAGVLLAFGATRILASLLYGIQPGDPMTFMSIAIATYVAAQV